MVAIKMGRLTKTKIDEIQRLHQEGYTKVEIAEKVGVSRGSVAKYASEVPGRGEGQVQTPQLLHEMVKTFYELLTVLNVMPYLKIEDVAAGVDQMALRFTERISQISPEIAKHVIGDNPYIEYLRGDILDLSKPDEELDEETRKQRHAWLNILKKFCPEKLAELI